MQVKCALNSKYITGSDTSKAPSHHNTSSSILYGGKYTCGDRPFTHTTPDKDMVVRTKDLKFGLKPKVQIFMAQASLFLLVSFSGGLFAAIWPWRPDSHSVLCDSWCWDVSVTWTLKYLFGLQFLRLVTNELALCSRGNSGSSIPVAVLMRPSFIIALEGCCDRTWRNVQSTWNVPYWLTLMS